MRMNKKKIFIFEFISGGGFNKDDIPSSLFCEGFGMLRSIIADFKAIGFNITEYAVVRIRYTDKMITKFELIRLANINDRLNKIGIINT